MTIARSLPARRGFTLVELLVSISLLVLLILLVSQMVNSAVLVTTSGRKTLDADSQARVALDRIASDLARMVKRDDVDYLFVKRPGNDRMFFYSEGPTFQGAIATAGDRSTFGLIGYRINTAYQLDRLGKALAWDKGTGSDPAVVFLTRPFSTVSPSPTPYPPSTFASDSSAAWYNVIGAGPDYNGTDVDYHPLADQVFRLEFCFQMANGSYSLDPTGSSASASGATAIDVRNVSNVRAIVVAIGVLDNTSRKMTNPSDADSLAQLVTALPDPATADLTANPPRLMAAQWQAALEKSDFANTAGIPRVAAAQVRLYQRTFPIGQ